MPIVIENGILDRLGAEILRICSDVVVVIDETVESIWGKKIFTPELTSMT